MSKAEYILPGQYALGTLRATPAIRPDSANGIELCGSYRSDLLSARDWIGRSSADALPHRIRMHEARRNPSPPGCRKHTPLGKPHARRILCRQTENRSRALLGSASRLVSFERKAIASEAAIGLLNWYERAGSLSHHPKALTLSEQPRSCGMSNWKHWRYRL